MLKKYNCHLIIQSRFKVTVTSFKQWKDLLVFKRHDGKHVWNIPKFIPHEFGFRRIARKPPFFKQRKFTFPRIFPKPYPSMDFLHNQDVYVRYGWETRCRDFHDLRDYVNSHYKGVNIVGIPVEEDLFEVVDQDFCLITKLNNPKEIDLLLKSNSS